MLGVYLLFFVPLVIFVLAFLYETFLSFMRLKNPKSGKTGYVHATWEVTHTLLVFAVVVLVMMFTKSIDQIANAIFVSTFIAALALAVRAALYTYIFYVRDTNKVNWVDWLFALSHVVAALFLVITVIQVVIFLINNNPVANEQFVPAFLPGLALVLAVCIVPIILLYTTKK
jgi:cytochrome bd-type quinol oxidase subunit 2